MPLELRKKRTRQHVIADISVHYVEGFILEEGDTAERLSSDYGYDLIMRTFDAAGFVEPGVVYFQLKATESLHQVETGYAFDLDIRDYNLWVRELVPVILILYDASKKRAYWLALQSYFLKDETRRPQQGAKTVRVRVPSRQAVSRSAIKRIRHLHLKAQGPKLGVL